MYTQKITASLLLISSLALAVSNAVADDLLVASYNVSSDEDTCPFRVAEDIKRIASGIHLWALSEVNRRDFETYRKAAGKNFKIISGTTGEDDRLAIIYDAEKLTQIGTKNELTEVGGSRLPLVAKFKIVGIEQSFLFIANHFQRKRSDIRKSQAIKLKKWVREEIQKSRMPIILAGDYNFDFSLSKNKGNRAFTSFMEGGTFRWIEPQCIEKGDCPPTGTSCDKRYDSILDFIFLAGNAYAFKASSTIEFKDERFYCEEKYSCGSDHRPVVAKINYPDIATSLP